MPDLQTELATKVLPLAAKWNEDEAPPAPPATEISKSERCYNWVRDNPGKSDVDAMHALGYHQLELASLQLADLRKRGYISSISSSKLRGGQHRQWYVTPVKAVFPKLNPKVMAALQMAYDARIKQAAEKRAAGAVRVPRESRKAGYKKTVLAAPADMVQSAPALPSSLAATLSAADIVDRMNVATAKAVYAELKKIFG